MLIQCYKYKQHIENAISVFIESEGFFHSLSPRELHSILNLWNIKLNLIMFDYLLYLLKIETFMRCSYYFVTIRMMIDKYEWTTAIKSHQRKYL